MDMSAQPRLDQPLDPPARAEGSRTGVCSPPAGAPPACSPPGQGARRPVSGPFDHQDDDYEPIEREAGPDDLGPPDPDGDPEVCPGQRSGVNDEAGSRGTVALGVEVAIDAELALAAKLVASAGLSRFLERRVEQARVHGHTPERDAELSPYMLANNAHGRFLAILDRLRGHPGRGNLEVALNTLENLGGMMLALHDRVSAELAATPADDREESQ